jgi:hypothetical protein
MMVRAPRELDDLGRLRTAGVDIQPIDFIEKWTAWTAWTALSLFLKRS